jgi:hypothetical protein
VNVAFPTTAEGLAEAVFFWFFLVAWVIVLGLILFVQLPRAFRDGRRIVTRVLRLVNDPPLTVQLAKAEADNNRLNLALERILPLQRRAEVAIATIRTTPLVPPAIGKVVRQIRAEISAFQQALR